ncbi:MAG: hypothetical protein ABJA67_10890, partial [Chthonomonadales bacterium]
LQLETALTLPRQIVGKVKSNRCALPSSDKTANSFPEFIAIEQARPCTGTVQLSPVLKRQTLTACKSSINTT